MSVHLKPIEIRVLRLYAGYCQRYGTNEIPKKFVRQLAVVGRDGDYLPSDERDALTDTNRDLSSLVTILWGLGFLKPSQAEGSFIVTDEAGQWMADNNVTPLDIFK